MKKKIILPIFYLMIISGCTKPSTELFELSKTSLDNEKTDEAISFLKILIK